MCLRVSLALFLVFAVGCKKDSTAKAPSLAVVYAGPISLNLRAEVTPGSKQSVAVKHGDKLDVIQVRRRFVKVRTQEGKEGWTDARNLLNAEQMDDLRELAKLGAALPSQGEATSYSALNMHAEPTRVSTSFYQITEGVRVEVVDHELVQKPVGITPPVTLKVDKPVRPVRKRPKKESTKLGPPPRGKAPELPPNWLELSKTELSEEEKRADEEEKRNAPKPPMEHWSLVRTKDRSKAGWVLSKNLSMAIPDEVAQYSEGARISSYFPLGEVKDEEGKVHNHWLWTTIRDGEQDFEFDSFRVFIWNARRHRYETSLVERGLEGYYPTEVSRGKGTTFSLIVRGRDGKLYRRTYSFEGYLVRKQGEALYTPPAASNEEAPAAGAAPTLTDKLKDITGKVLK